MILNTAGQKIGAQLVTAADGSAFTGAVTVAVTGDAGTQATGSVGAGACVHEGGGYHTYAPAQAETNYALVAFTFSGSGAVPATVQVYTIPVPVGSLSTGAITTTSFASGAINAAAIGADAITDAKVAADVTIASVTGSVGSVTGAVGSVSGAVGSVTGSVGSIASGGITTASFAAGAINAAAIGADAITDAKVASDVTIASVTGAVGSVTGNVGGNVVGSVASVTAMTTANVIQISGDTTAADALELAFDGTAGPVPELGIIDRGTAQAATGTTLQLRAAAAFADNEPIGATIVILTATTGAGQARQITDYVSSTDTATVAAWTTTPTGTITYAIFGSAPSGLNDLSAADILTQVNAALDAVLADSIPADGSRPSLRQAAYLIAQFLFERSVSSTTLTVKKVDGSTSLATFTLNDATNPTSITRAS